MRLLDRSETERLGSATDLLAALGYAGDTRKVLSAAETVRAVPPSTRTVSLDETLARGVRHNYRVMALWVILFLLFRGAVSGAITLVGFVLFYRAHNRLAGWRKAALILTAFGVVGVSWLAASAGRSAYLTAAVKWLSPALFTVFYILSAVMEVVAFFLFPGLACGAYARANRLRRERTLLRAASTSPDEYVALLGKELEYRYEDVGFHLKYAESLAARGDDRAAAVEARLLLLQDPYHFGGNLLLAQCYARLGLFDECERVCTEYLAVTGYSFEFEELRQRCRATRGAPA
jgi:hypothetical protein